MLLFWRNHGDALEVQKLLLPIFSISGGHIHPSSEATRVNIIMFRHFLNAKTVVLNSGNPTE